PDGSRRVVGAKRDRPEPSHSKLQRSRRIPGDESIRPLPNENRIGGGGSSIIGPVPEAGSNEQVRQLSKAVVGERHVNLAIIAPREIEADVLADHLRED